MKNIYCLLALFSLLAPSLGDGYYDSTSIDCGSNGFRGVKYYAFEIQFMKTLDDSGSTEEYALGRVWDHAYRDIELRTDGWIVNQNWFNKALAHTKCFVTLNNLKNEAGGYCHPPDKKESSNGIYSCFLKDDTTGSDFAFVVPEQNLPASFTFDFAIIEEDSGVTDSGSKIVYYFDYTSPLKVADLPWETDVRTSLGVQQSSDGRKQRLRWKQKRMCFSRADFDEEDMC